MKILVVDDKEENAYYLRALLSAHGYEVETAQHGAEALLKARQSPPALVISDLLMPVMDGYTLLRHWKSDTRLKGLPFVVYTATYTDPEDERLALNLGADAFILKPAEPDAFLARVRALEGLKESGRLAVEGAANAADDAGLLREYSETLIRKLEEKTLQLEASNARLQSDIRARQSAEAALRESEARFRQLAENIDDVFWLTDLEHRLIYVSPAYENVWRRSRESLYQNPDELLESIHAEDRALVRELRERAASGKWDETFRILRPDGSMRWVRARSFPVPDTSGKIYRIAGVSRDITDYRLLEEQFRQAQKMEAIGRLAGGVAHDFNNLLSVILSYTVLGMERLDPSDPTRLDLEEVRRAGERATSLTRQLLAFSRQQMLEPRVLDLGQVIGEMAKMLQRLLGEDISLVLSSSGARGKVHVDPSQMEQIVMNLAVNARDAMPRGGKLTIEVSDEELGSERPGAPPGHYVVLTVSDNGLGMDAATRERIFEPFFTTKELGKGTGLGLSTVFGIVMQSRGHIYVQSQPDTGSVFKIYFPCCDQGLELPTKVSLMPTDLRGSETILIVEDDEQVRKVNLTILLRNGYHVLEARDAREALLVSEKFSDDIHLLLTDVVMPRMSGRELADRLALTRPKMRVLYLSGYAQSAVLQNGLAEPGIVLLQKPTTPDALLLKVREVLSSAELS